MKTASCGVLLLAVISGCSTALVDRPALVPQHSDSGPEPPSRTIDARSASPSCLVSGQSRTLAEKVRLRGGIEIVSNSNKISIGFTTGPNDAVTVDMDPSSGNVTRRVSQQSADPIRRVTPFAHDGNETAAALDTSSESNRLKGPRTVAGRQGIVIGTADRHLAWASSPADLPHALWPLPEGPVLDMSAIQLRGDKGFAIVFRQGGSIWLGTLDSDRKPKGPLSRIAVRSSMRQPTLAESGGALLVVWAEQVRDDKSWSLGGVHVAAGVTTAIRLDLPAGVLGGDAIQPGLAGLEGGRFLLVWTEGPVWAHQVRAMTVESTGAPVGAAMTVSTGADANRGSPVVAADGHGAIVFVSTTDDGFSLVTTPIACPNASPADAAPVVSVRETGSR